LTETEAKKRALAYMKETLGREAHYLDSSPTDEGWAVRVIVAESRARPGGTGTKEWHVLYEVHLDESMEPLYHVRRGFWTEKLPTTSPGGAGGDNAPVVGTGPRGAEAEAVGVEDDVSAPESREDVEAGRASEEPEESAAASPGKESEEDMIDTAEPEPEPEEEFDEVETDLEEETVDEAVDEEDTALDEDLAEDEGLPADDEPASGEESEPDGPSRPAVQEIQGPPKVSFRYARDEEVHRPEADEPASGEADTEDGA